MAKRFSISMHNHNTPHTHTRTLTNDSYHYSAFPFSTLFATWIMAHSCHTYLWKRSSTICSLGLKTVAKTKRVAQKQDGTGHSQSESGQRISKASVMAHLTFGGSLIMILSQIYCWITIWKNFKNQSAFTKIMHKSTVTPFLTQVFSSSRSCTLYFSKYIIAKAKQTKQTQWYF